MARLLSTPLEWKKRGADELLPHSVPVLAPVESLALQLFELFPLLGRQHALDRLAVFLAQLAHLHAMGAAKPLELCFLRIAQIQLAKGIASPVPTPAPTAIMVSSMPKHLATPVMTPKLRAYLSKLLALLLI